MTTEQSREDAQPLLKVSVIVPVYNGRNTLERCLRAVAASDYPN
jgi:glycosyltransferase involved in cell wall biosynthesis